MRSRTHHSAAIQDLDRSFGCLPRRRDKRDRWHDYRELRNKNAISLNAAIYPHAIASCGLRLSNVGVEKLRQAKCIHHFHVKFPQLEAREYSTTRKQHRKSFFRPKIRNSILRRNSSEQFYALERAL
jgi:hypothetical protein